MFPKSIRWRLQIWYGLILIAVLAGFGFTTFQLAGGRQLRKLDDELRHRVAVLSSGLGIRPEDMNPGRQPNGPDDMGFPPPEGPEGRERPAGGRGKPPGLHLTPQQQAMFDAADPDGFYFVVWRRDDTEMTRSPNAPAAVPVPVRSTTKHEPDPPRSRGLLRESFIVMPPGEILLAGKSVAAELAEIRRLGWSLAGVGGAVLLFGLAGGWWLATRAIRPIEEISAAAVKISAGDLSQRIDAADTESELGRLAGVLNSSWARLEAAFAQQRQFTSDAAHELRTPISVMLTQTQSALKRERTVADYRETVEACERSAQRMRRLIESLLELSRFDAGQEALKQMRFDLANTARDCVELVKPLAEPRGIKILCGLSPAECSGDSERLAQVITNLLSNAIHYNKDGGEVRVATRTEGDFAVVVVADNGPGIAPEHLARIFDRFYRVDGARTTTAGRTGLGLAISKAIVEAHGGSIEVASEPGKGTTFTVRLPTAKE